MTSRLLSPRRRSRAVVPASIPALGGTAATPILDWHHPSVVELATRAEMTLQVFDQMVARSPQRELVRIAHRLIGECIHPVYAMNDEQPVSVTIARGRGSCSQRMAVLEAVARARGIATRVRGRMIDGAFWYPRFPCLCAVVPTDVVLAWPEFWIDEGWVPVSELYDGLCLVSGFSNRRTETLFDAVARTAVDWDGTSSPSCDLSAHVRADLGYFDSRDELFRLYGQTLCQAARLVADPVLSRRSA
ncbi:transglutaminase domain-containing protein [Nonomuraea turkmeniaca]|uniref:Transglutaminase domain-containing protein n=1 Tax=Nonomuraea turkmeniaca TaxID=103838 RepID=A0A5S4F6Y0_9ACTN|nr:transglutaminase domain-containing protein [Nonomuraea turkmeniaca]